MAKSPINNAGSRAGRGFRYQDAVGALLAVQGWAGVSPYGEVTPEAHDDFDLAGTVETAFAQVKSRRDEAGLFSAADVAAFVSELWDRHGAATTKPEALLLILERSFKGAAAPAAGFEPLPPAILSVPRLRDDPRAAALAVKTRLLVLPSPMEDAIALIAETLACMPAEASIHYGEILRRIGQLSDENGTRGPGRFMALAKTDVASLIEQMRSLVSLGDMDAALQAGLCEAVDFITPVADETFYLGVDVEPGHLAAGLVAERPEARRDVLDALDSRGLALVAGPSGAGKSALMWDAASASRHVVRWYRVRSLTEAQVPMLPRLARALRAHPAAPVGFVFDDVGGELRAAWDAMARLTPPASGTLLLGSIREEDLFLLETRPRAAEIRAEADDALAERLWNELRERGQTVWAGWREPWTMAKRLMLEFAHILTQGERMATVLTEQVDRREREGRDLELSILRVASFAGASSAVVDPGRLPAVLTAPPPDVSRALRRLMDEHLLRTGPDGLLGGMHQLRSAEILRLTHRTPPPDLAATIAQTTPTVPAASLEALVANADLSAPQLAVMVEALARRLEAEPDPLAAAAAFRGLGERHIHATLGRWLPTIRARGVPSTQISTAVMFGITGVDLPDLEPLQQTNAAAKDLRAAQSGDPRRVLLTRLSSATLARLAANATPAEIEEMLASLVGADAGLLLQALRARAIDLASLDLDLVVRLLGTIALHDVDLALGLVAAAGQDVLLDRLHRETPWTSPFTVADEADGKVATGEVRFVAASVQTDLHAEVVAVADKLFALVPDADFAAVSAVSPDGEPAGLPDFPTAVKRMVRSAAPPEALPRWNRRWMSATSALLGAVSYSDFLERGYRALALAAPALEQVVEAILRGKDAERPLARLGEAYDISRELTSPSGTVAIAGAPAAESGAYVSDLQSTVHDAASDLPRKVIHLPDSHGAFAIWTEGLLERVERARQEPWALIGADADALLDRVSAVIRSLQVMAGEAAARGQNPALLWRTQAKKARPGNALRFVARLAEQGVARGLTTLKANLVDQLTQDGLTGAVHVRQRAEASVAWPFASVLVVIECDALSDWHPLVIAHWEALKAAAGDGRRLVLAPSVGGLVIGRLAIEGVSMAFPSPYEADDWLKAEGYTLLEDANARHLAQLMDAVFEQDAMRLYGYGEASRPPLEQETRQAAGVARERVLGTLLQAIAKEAPDFPDRLRDFLRRIDDGELAFAEELAATLHGYETAAGQQLDRLQGIMLTIDLITQLKRAEAAKAAMAPAT